MPIISKICDTGLSLAITPKIIQSSVPLRLNERNMSKKVLIYTGFFVGLTALFYFIVRPFIKRKDTISVVQPFTFINQDGKPVNEKDVAGKVTVIARGVPVGGDLEYADEITLGRSIMGRTLFS